MSLFGSDVTQAPEITAFETPQEGVVKGPSLLGIAADAFDSASEIFADSKKKKADHFVGEFTHQQLLLADAYAQGNRSLEATRTRMRKNLMDAIAANPTIAGELIKSQKDILGLEAGAKAVRDGTEQDQRRAAVYDQLVSEGLVSFDADQDELDEAYSDWQMAKQASVRLQEEIATIDLALKKNTLSSAVRADKEARRKELMTEFIRSSSPFEFRKMSADLDKIANSNSTEAEKVRLINEHFTIWQHQMSQATGMMDSREAEAFMAPFKMMRDQYIQAATGELSIEELKRSNERTMEANRNLVLTDPYLAGLVAASDLGLDMGIFGEGEQRNVYNKFMEIFAGLDDNPEVERPNVFKTDRDSNKALDMTMDQIRSGLESNDEKKQAGALRMLDNFFMSMEESEGKLRVDPKTGKELVKLLASQKMGELITKNKGVLEHLEGAAEIMQRHYTDEVLGLVEREFQKAKVYPESVISSVEDTTGGGVFVSPDQQKDVKDAVLAVASETGVTFKAADPKDTGAVMKARELNKELKPIINQVVQATAHLEGHKNYKQVWESMSSTVLGGGEGDDRLAGGDADDDLNLEDFRFPTVSSGGLPKHVQEDTEFLTEVEKIANKHGFDPSVMLAVMDFETGGSFNPAKKNAAGSSGTGLIQFMANTAKSLGTSVQELSRMSRKEQMVYVDKYFSQFDLRGADASSVYMAVLFPKAINKSDDYVLFRKGTLAYSQNRGLDKNGSGTVTKAEAASKVVDLVGKYA